MDQLKIQKTDHNNISCYISNTIFFSTKVPSSQGFLKTKDRMTNMYFRCQLPSLSLQILKCHNSKLQMLPVQSILLYNNIH
jgi:hypothetical protein